MTRRDRRTKEELVAEISALRRELEAARGLSPSPPASSPTDDVGENDERYRSVVDTVVDGIISIDDSGFIQSFNPAAEKIFGYSAEDMIGQNVSLLMPSPDREQHGGYVDRYLRTGEKKIIGIGRQVVGQRKDGSTFPMALAIGWERLFRWSCSCLKTCV